MLFFFNAPATTEIYTLSLHDALPILRPTPRASPAALPRTSTFDACAMGCPHMTRSEEHTSELQSLTNLVCRLLLEKKKTRPPASFTLSSLTTLCIARAGLALPSTSST